MNDAIQQAKGIETTSFDNVNALCRSFAEEADKESQLSIEDYLRHVADGAQPTLLRNLLDLDIKRRRAAGQSPGADEYLARLPEFADLIRQAFLDASAVSHGTRSVAEGIASTWDFPKARPALAATRLGEYELLRELGRGGMGTVYEAVHVRRGDRVALKTLPAVDGSRLHRFKREFRSLADVNHPNLIGLGTLEADGCHWFFTMDLIEGTDFLSYVRPVSVGNALRGVPPTGDSQPERVAETAVEAQRNATEGVPYRPATPGGLDIDRLRAGLPQLVAAVMALHGQHIIHRDLKPSNVMVTRDGRVVVLDFGLVIESKANGGMMTTGHIEGTPRYMSPEQAAGESVTAAADWYAVGVMLYEALVGRPPFDGPVLKLLQDKQRLDAPPLPANAGLPEDLVQLTMRLLARDPLARPDAREIAKAISLQTLATPVTHSSRSTLVGRSSQLNALAEAHQSVAARHQPLMVFIRGRSGEGKTSLAEHFLEGLRGRPAPPTILSGRCYDRESVPFKALDSLIDALCGHLRSLDKTEAALMLPDDVGLLAQLFPVLERVEVVAQAPRPRTSDMDEQQVRTRAFAALRLLLARLSSRRSVVMFADDLQWGDASSAEALFAVLRPPEAPTVLLLGSFRSDEWNESPFRLEWENVQKKHGISIEQRDVSVSPLSVEECQELVTSLLGRDNETIRRRALEIHAETGGNPFLLIELVSCFDPDTDSFRPVPMHEAVRQKLSRLPAESEALLDIVSVSGQALPLADVSTTAGHDAPAMATITHMRTERLLRLLGNPDEPLVDTYHDRIRETVLGQMEPPKRQGLHLSLAKVLESGIVTSELMAAVERGEEVKSETSIARVYDLAYHFEAAGSQRQALAYSLLAAEQACRHFAPEVAARQFEIAKRNVATSARAARFRIVEGYGESLMRLGRYVDAERELEGAMEHAGDDLDKARIERLRGELMIKAGRIQDSVEFCESAIRRLSNRASAVPRTLTGFLIGILREVAVQASHSLFPGRLHRRRASKESQILVHTLTYLPSSYIFFSTPKSLWGHLAMMNRVEVLPQAPPLASAYGLHACFMGMLGWHSRSARYGERAVAIAEKFDNVLARGYAHGFYGIGSYASSRYEVGIEVLSKAMAAFEKTGDFLELHLARFHKGCCHFGLGDLAQAIAEARWVFESSARIGDSRTMCSSWLWARATQGNFPFEETKSCCPSRPDDIMSTVHGVMAEGLWHSFHGREAESLQAFERAAGMVKKSLCVNSHTILVLPMLARAVRRHAETLHAGDPRRVRELKRALRLAKWAARLTRLFPAAYPLSLRELSLALAARGRLRAALRAAERSCAVALRQKAKYEYAQSLLVRGEIACQLGRFDGPDLRREAQAQLQVIEQGAIDVPNPLAPRIK
jgi:eukaryotic-like serine/threonine-protein kinase